MLGQSMLGAGPTMTLVAGARAAADRGLRRWGAAALAVGALEVGLGWWWLWPMFSGGGSTA